MSHFYARSNWFWAALLIVSAPLAVAPRGVASTLGNDSGNAVAVSSFNGQIYITGSCFNPITGNTDAFVAEFSPAPPCAQVRFTTIPDASGGMFNSGNGIAIDPNTGNIYVTGYIGVQKQVFVACFDPFVLGLVSMVTLPSYAGGPDSGNAIAFDPINKVLDVTGYFSSNGTRDAFIVQFDPMLNLNWGPILINPLIPGSSGNAIAVDPLGYAFVTGYMTDNNGRQDVLCAIYDSMGVQTMLVPVLPVPLGPGPDSGNGIAVDPQRNIFVVGYAVDQDGIQKAFVARLADDCSIGCSYIVPPPLGSGLNSGNAIALDGASNMNVTGYVMNGIWLAMFGVNCNPLCQNFFPPVSGNGIAVDNQGNAYSTGAWSNNFGFTDAYVGKSINCAFAPLCFFSCL